MRIPVLMAVAAGSALGALARFGISLLAFDVSAVGLPWHTLEANVIGSFLVGWIAAACAPQGRLTISEPAYQFLVTGFCGGFTTLSLFSLELYILIEQGVHLTALLYGALSLVLWFAAVAAGFALGSWGNKTRA